MTPKDKAMELVDRFLSNHFQSGGIGMNIKQAKRCASICVDEMEKLLVGYGNFSIAVEQREYLEKVKIEPSISVLIS